MFAAMVLKNLYRQYLQQLQIIYPANEVALITDWVFSTTAGVTKAALIKYPQQEVSEAVEVQLKDQLVALLQHKPVQYVLGEAWFYNMRLKVNEHTLIPRPETEELVKLVLDEYIGNQNTANQLLDIGTGSGCIAIALKKNLPNSHITAIDISEDALNVSKENAISQEVLIDFKKVDLLDDSQWKTLPLFNTIVSNPPYIPLHEKSKLDKNVSLFEPAIALFTPDENPLIFFEKIAFFGKSNLLLGGKIFVEVHEDYARATDDLFKSSYSSSTIFKDMFGKQRMIAVK